MAASLWSADAAAMSCASFEDRFVVECRAGECLPILRARDLGAFGNPCQRRLEVEEIPLWIRPELQRVSAGAGWETGVHVITYEYAFPADPSSLQKLRLAASSREPVLRALEGTVSSIRTAFENRENAELWGERWRKATEFLLGMVMLVAVVWTSRSFWQKVSRPSGASKLRNPLAVQAGLALGGIAWLPLFAFSGYGLALVLSVPLVLVVLAVEVGSWFFVSRRKRRSAG
jgi:hypothetical protein